MIAWYLVIGFVSLMVIGLVCSAIELLFENFREVACAAAALSLMTGFGWLVCQLLRGFQ